MGQTLRQTLRQTVQQTQEPNPAEAPKRILIAHQLLLGDTLMVTALLAKLRQAHPSATLVMVMNPAFVSLYASQPFGVQALPFSLRDQSTVTALFAQPAFDLAYIPGDNRHSWLARALGAKVIVAHAEDQPSYKSWFVTHSQPFRSSPAAFGDLLTDLVAGPAPAPFQSSDWPVPANAQPVHDITAQPYAVLHVGASTPLKNWESDKWRALAWHLQARGLTVIYSAGRGEEALVEAADPDARYRSLAGQLGLAELFQVLRGAALVVCPDTGVAHLSRIAGVPSVVLFGPGSSVAGGGGDFFSAAPSTTVEIAVFHCRDQQMLFKRKVEWVRRCSRSTRECAAPRCMQAISLDRVKQAVDYWVDQIK